MAEEVVASEELPYKRVQAIAWVLVLGALAPMLDATMANIAINHLATDFKSGVDLIQWVITGYVLAMAVAVPFSGWLIDRFNGKTIYIAGELIFLLGSLGSAMAPNLNWLIGARLLQGFGSGIVIPLLTTLLMTMAGKNAGKLMSTVGLPMVLGPILGPVIGAVIIQNWSWRYIFWVNIPVVIIAVIIIMKMLPSFPARNKAAKLDFIGVGLLASASSFIMYGVTQAAKAADIFNHDTLLYGGVGFGLLALYVIWALVRKTKAVMPLNLFKHKSFAASSIGLLLGGLMINGPMLILPLYLQNGRNMSVIAAGLTLIPQGIGMLIARPMIGKLIDQIGARYVTLVSLVFTVVGTIPFAYFDSKTSMVWIAAALLVRGIGVGGVFMPLMTDAYTGLEKDQIAQATIGTRITQNIGGSFGSAILATVMANSLLNSTTDFKVKLAKGVYHVSQTDMPSFMKQMAAGFQMDAYHTAFWVSIVVTFVTVIPAMFLTNKSKKQATK
ncbi:MAG: multidrug efflux MFS transporter [Lactobacillaceae bacterium]|jgi:EmrB/QacA subfamily drug resistance transporter|nr:multidrug efflux MFS transporter [Lactobacillaceae bacterium]